MRYAMGGSSAEGRGGGGDKSGCPGIFFSPDPALLCPPVPLFFSFTFSTSPMFKPPPWDTGSFGFGLGAGSVPPPEARPTLGDTAGGACSTVADAVFGVTVLGLAVRLATVEGALPAFFSLTLRIMDGSKAGSGSGKGLKTHLCKQNGCK